MALFNIGEFFWGAASEKFCRLFGVLVCVPSFGWVVANAGVEFVVAAYNDVNHPILVSSRLLVSLRVLARRGHFVQSTVSIWWLGESRCVATR